MARDNAGFTLAYAFGFPAYRCVYGHTIGASCRSWRLRVHFSAGEPLFERSGSVTSGRPLRLTTQNTRISISTCTVRSVVLLFYKLPRVEIGLAVLVALAILPRLQPLLDRRSAGADRAVRLALRSGRFCRGPHSSRGAAWGLLRPLAVSTTFLLTMAPFAALPYFWSFVTGMWRRRAAS